MGFWFVRQLGTSVMLLGVAVLFALLNKFGLIPTAENPQGNLGAMLIGSLPLIFFIGGMVNFIASTALFAVFLMRDKLEIFDANFFLNWIDFFDDEEYTWILTAISFTIALTLVLLIG